MIEFITIDASPGVPFYRWLLEPDVEPLPHLQASVFGRIEPIETQGDWTAYANEDTHDLPEDERRSNVVACDILSIASPLWLVHHTVQGPVTFAGFSPGRGIHQPMPPELLTRLALVADESGRGMIDITVDELAGRLRA